MPPIGENPDMLFTDNNGRVNVIARRTDAVITLFVTSFSWGVGSCSLPVKSQKSLGSTGHYLSWVDYLYISSHNVVYLFIIHLTKR